MYWFGSTTSLFTDAKCRRNSVKLIKNPPPHPDLLQSLILLLTTGQNEAFAVHTDLA